MLNDEMVSGEVIGDEGPCSTGQVEKLTHRVFGLGSNRAAFIPFFCSNLRVSDIFCLEKNVGDAQFSNLTEGGDFVPALALVDVFPVFEEVLFGAQRTLRGRFGTIHFLLELVGFYSFEFWGPFVNVGRLVTGAGAVQFPPCTFVETRACKRKFAFILVKGPNDQTFDKSF